MTWLTPWLFRKEITASGAASNFQVSLTVGESSGASGADVHCGGNCLSTFADLRFTNAAGDLLPYWIEAISGTTPDQIATVWVKLDSVLTTDTTFFLYYGNAAAISASSGSDVFILFDDFEGHGSAGTPISGDWDVQEAKVSALAEGSLYADRVNQYNCEIDSGYSTYSNNHISAAVLTSLKLSVRATVRHYRSSSRPSLAVAIGNGTKVALVEIYYYDQHIRYCDTAPWAAAEWDPEAYYHWPVWTETGAAVPSGAVWHEIELRNVDFSTGTYDIYYTDGTDFNWILAASGVDMYVVDTSEEYPLYPNITNFNTQLSFFQTRNQTAGKPIYLDNVLVLNAEGEAVIETYGVEDEFRNPSLDADLPELRLSDYGAYAYTGDTVGWGVLPALAIEAQAGPFIIALEGTLPQISLSAGFGGVLEKSLPELQCTATMGADRSIRTGDYFNGYATSLPELGGEGAFGVNVSMIGRLPALECEARTGARASGKLPYMEMSASGSAGHIARLGKKLPTLMLAASMGARLEGKLPVETMVAAATTPVLMRMDKKLPALTLVATVSGASGSLVKPLPVLSLEAAASRENTASLSKKLSPLRLISTAKSGATMSLDATLPELRGTARSYSAVISLDAYLPALTTGTASGTTTTSGNVMSTSRFDDTLLRYERWA